MTKWVLLGMSAFVTVMLASAGAAIAPHVLRG